LVLALMVVSAIIFAWAGFTRTTGNPATRYGIAFGGLFVGAFVGLCVLMLLWASWTWLARLQTQRHPRR